jgi:hypothetical protein
VPAHKNFRPASCVTDCRIARRIPCVTPFSSVARGAGALEGPLVTAPHGSGPRAPGARSRRTRCGPSPRAHRPHRRSARPVGTSRLSTSDRSVDCDARRWSRLSYVRDAPVARRGRNAIRYVVAVLAAYSAFLFLIRVWIALHCGRRPNSLRHLPDVLPQVDPDFLKFRSSPFAGFAGGRSGGAGAGYSWQLAEPPPLQAGTTAAASDALNAIDASFDEDRWWLILLLLAALGALVPVGYVIYVAPALLRRSGP